MKSVYLLIFLLVSSTAEIVVTRNYENTNLDLMKLGLLLMKKMTQTLEPIHLNHQVFTWQNSSCLVSGSLINTKIRGLSKFDIGLNDFDAQNLKFDISLELPRVVVEGNYTVNIEFCGAGNLDIKGPFSTEFDDVSANVKTTVGIVNHNAQLEQLDVDLNFADYKVNFPQTDAPDATNFLNVVFSKHGKVLFNLLKPTYGKEVIENVRVKANEFLQSLDLNSVGRKRFLRSLKLSDFLMNKNA